MSGETPPGAQGLIAGDSFQGKRRSLIVIAIAQVLALSIWFSGAAALPGLVISGALSPFHQAALTTAVQIGFVVGALTSAVLGLADRMDPRRLFAIGAIIAAVSNLIAVNLPADHLGIITTRCVAGAALALVYPVGMKLAVSWARGDAGFLVGLLVGALTLGSAIPYIFNIADIGLEWQTPMAVSALAAFISALLIFISRPGPGLRVTPAFDPQAALITLKDPALRLVNFGYLGHMWELYAMWAWIGPFLHVYWSRHSAGSDIADLTTFSVIAVGGLACLASGLAADRYGRTTITIAAMAISGACAVLSALLFDASPWWMIPLLLVWGMAVIADSAQFSTAIAELSPPQWTGTLLTLQTALGFALTAVIVQALPLWIDFAGWRYAFVPLAIGPAFGVWAMWKLRTMPDALKLAGGKR
jgi:MFS family permease